MAAADRRYEWREMNGVTVLRSSAAWERGDHPLNGSVPAIQLPGIRARNALGLIAALLDGPQYKEVQLGDTKRFALRVDTGTVLDVLNATVSAHGELAWAFEAKPADSMFPFTVTLWSGASRSGCGVPGRSPEQAVDVLRYADAPLFSVAGSATVLDRIVRTSASDRPLVINGPFPSAVRDLANATRVPMGIEFLGPGNPPRSAEIPATGRTLRDVLDAMVAINPRYEWREMDGVIVIRPTASWNNPQSLFFRLVPGERMHDVSPQEAVERLARQLGHNGRLGGIPGGKLLSNRRAARDGPRFRQHHRAGARRDDLDPGADDSTRGERRISAHVQLRRVGRRRPRVRGPVGIAHRVRPEHAGVEHGESRRDERQRDGERRHRGERERRVQPCQVMRTTQAGLAAESGLGDHHFGGLHDTVGVRANLFV